MIKPFIEIFDLGEGTFSITINGKRTGFCVDAEGVICHPDTKSEVKKSIEKILAECYPLKENL